MRRTNWREIVEIIGVISIVASLLLLATEVRQSNRIASTELEVQLIDLFNENNRERAFNTEYAKLFAKLQEPDAHLITATEQQQIRGLAWHYVNTFYVAQTAYNNGLLTQNQLEEYKEDLQATMDRYPALVPHFLDIRESRSWIGAHSIYSPIMELETENQ